MNEKKFDILMKELEGCVNKLENGEIELEKALEMYQEGITIIKELNKRLEDAKSKMEVVENDQ